ncbi:zinc finger protein 827 isoform X2 [Scleropages formosus]|uniref:zinc finger protein 827 isoform X2 n=1 Tax=Scleropages formosus TaxID=113540 RepID=UPI0010FAACE7|nr:zinc finger protein 827 isoform X2 [Scleropages formosus]
MPRRKQEQPKRLPSHVDSVEDDAAERGPVEEDGWFGNASDTPSESSYGDLQDDLRATPDRPRPEQDASAESSLGCPTPVPLLGLEGDALRPGPFSAQDSLSSVVSSLYGEASRALGKPLSSNLRRLLEAGELTFRERAGESPPTLGLGLLPTSHHAQQLSALARKLANSNNNNGSSSATASPASVPPPPAAIKQEPCDGGSGFVWAGAGDVWPPSGCSAPSSSLSPDSAIQKLKAAANAVLQDKSAVASSSSSSSSSCSSSCSSSMPAAAGGRSEEAVRFDAFSSPFNPQSASSTLAALSKKVSERGLSGGQVDPQGPGGPFLSLVSMTSSAALLKEVAARAAGNLLADKNETPLVPGPSEDVKPLLEHTQKPPTCSQTADLHLPSTPKGRAKVNHSQGGSPEDVGKPFQCPVCGLVIKRKSYWKRHMVIHTGLKSHQCPLCPFRCARKDNLKSHMKVHQHQDRGETFQCELCPFTSSRHFSLKLHMRCHQHFPRAEARVKEEAATDTEGESSPPAAGGPEGPATGTGSPSQPSPTEAPGHPLVKEEPQERDVSAPSHFGLCSPSDPPRVKGSPPGPTAASLFSPDITTKAATDLLMKISAANQKEALKTQLSVKEEPQGEEARSPRLPHAQPGYMFCQEGPGAVAERVLKPRDESPLAKSSLLSQDINIKVASELLMKLSENSKEASLRQVTVKAEPMEVDPPEEPSLPPVPPRLLGFSALPGCEASEPLSSLPEPLVNPQKALFSQDISVKMASELLYKLSEKVNKANDHKDGNMLGMNSPYLDDRFRQSPFGSGPKEPASSEASSSGRVLPLDWEKAGVDPGNGRPQWRLSEQLYPCPVCGKVFGRQQTLSRHLSLHTEERKYKCHLCPYAAKCRANLNQHLTIHSVKLVSTDAEHIVTAVTTESAERKNCPYYYSCHVCGFHTELNAHFVSHMSLHVDREQWMYALCCSVCDYTCSEEADMKAHVSADHAGLNPRSPLSETKSTSSSLSALSDSLNGSECGEAAHSSEELKSLLAPPSSAGSQSSSGSLSGSGAEDKPEKGFECVFCNFVCKTRTMYERHLQIHLITRMFECDICHKFMKTPEQLLEHKKCHAVPSGGLKMKTRIQRPAGTKDHRLRSPRPRGQGSAASELRSHTLTVSQPFL